MEGNKMTREECMQTENHVEWLKHPEWWFNHNPAFCAVKKGDVFNDGLLGIVLPGKGPKVYLGNIYSYEPFTEEKSIVYESFETMVADGWVVD
jgi:hypothetical protein